MTETTDHAYDHAAHAISAYGSEINTTPRIDEIARLGRRFDNCFATNALCSPSRASILTGTYSHVNGVTTLVTPIDAAQPSFIGALRSSGYRPGLPPRRSRMVRQALHARGIAAHDLLLDPAETRNVHDDPAYAAVRDEMTIALWNEQARLGDQPHPSQPRPATP